MLVVFFCFGFLVDGFSVGGFGVEFAYSVVGAKNSLGRKISNYLHQSYKLLGYLLF